MEVSYFPSEVVACKSICLAIRSKSVWYDTLSYVIASKFRRFLPLSFFLTQSKYSDIGHAQFQMVFVSTAERAFVRQAIRFEFAAYINTLHN